jgi:hypothetical protein
MGYVPMHLYLITGDKRFDSDYIKEERFNRRGLIIVSIVSFGSLIGGLLYCLLYINGRL